MPGAYNEKDLLAMSPEEIAAAAARGWNKPAADPADARPETTDRTPQPSGDVWKRRKSGADVFTCPSGQTCRLRSITPDKLLLTGILDRVNSLETLAAKLAHDAQGNPPVKETMPTREEFAELLSVINKVVPLAVAEPTVLPDPAPGEEEDGVLYVSDIDLDDRMAIMAEALKGIRALDRFRNAG